MTERRLSAKWKQLAAITALAIGPACADMDEPRDGEPLLEDEEGDRGELPDAPSGGLTTYDRNAAVPGFAVDISIGGETGEDVVLDWSGNGFAGDVMVYRATDPNALLDISLDGPLAPGVEGTMVGGTTLYVDEGAASRTAATPHYFYRVGLVQYGELGTELQLSTMVMKTTTAAGPGFNRLSLCMLGGPDSASDISAMFGPSVLGVHQRIPGGTNFMSFRSWTPGGGEDFSLSYGAGVVAQLDASADPYLSLVGVVPTSEAMAVSAEPGYNWMTLPVLYDGPTSTSYWVDTVGYWGVGAWSNLAQGSTWDWQDPGYAPFEMETCQTYDVYLQDDACTSNADCPENEFCYFVEAAACGDVGSGLCFPRPPGCEGVPESPVCGCDGQTYASQCEADLAGVAVAAAGSGEGGGTLVFDFEGELPVLESSGNWALYTEAPPSYQNAAVPFPSQVLGTDGNRLPPYPGDDNENSFATLGPITLGSSLSLSSWHVDEGGGYYDRKRIYFQADSGETWVLADCAGGINADQAFCQFDSSSRPGDLWDDIVLDTGILSGQTGTLRFEYQTLDGCCSFEQGWFIDDIRVNGCNSAEVTSGPPVPAPNPNECPAQCLDMIMYEQLVLDPAAGPINACYQNDWGNGGNAQIDGEGGYAEANWNDFGSGSCSSYSPELGYQQYNLSNTQAEACGNVIEAQIAALGPACNGVQPICGNGILDAGEQCDGGDLAGNSCGSLGLGGGALSCNAECTYDTSACAPLGGGGGGGGGGSPGNPEDCGNPSGGPLAWTNGTGIAGEVYCYEANDTVQELAQKACESHFGEGNCCIITGGYQDQQYGQCDLGGYDGSIHWHWDNHPEGHCAPNYVVGDVVAPGWCGNTTGNFLPGPQEPENPNACPAACLGLPMFQELVQDPAAGPIDSCYESEYGATYYLEIVGEGGMASVELDTNAGGGTCTSSSPVFGEQTVDLTFMQAQACTLIMAFQIDALGPACQDDTPVCGNGVQEPGEQCDGADLNGVECSDNGWTGTLMCSPICTFNWGTCDIPDGV